MSTTPRDPTNANAVPGPSRHPYVAIPPPEPPERPSLARIDPSGSAPPTEPKPVPTHAHAPPPRRRADGPVIVPTVVSPDGAREVPPLFEHCQVEDLIALIASMLDRLIEHNDRIPLTPNSLTRFHSRAPPSIGVRDYLLRIARYTNVEPCCLLILLPYVDKVCARMNTFTISSLTVHRFIIAAVSVGSKALSDAFCTNGRYSRVGGVSVVEMNLLEKEFCEAIDWRLTTSGSVLAHYYTSLVRSHPKYRLSAAPLPGPAREPPPAMTDVSSSSNSSASSSSYEASSAAQSVIAPNGVVPGASSASMPPSRPDEHSATTSPAASSSSRSMTTSASSSSMSIDPSPALSTTSLPTSTRSGVNGVDQPPVASVAASVDADAVTMTSSCSSHPSPPPPPPSSSSSSSSPRLHKNNHSARQPPLASSLPSGVTGSVAGTSTPPLVPPNLSRRIVTASNLPSPNPVAQSRFATTATTTNNAVPLRSPRFVGPSSSSPSSGIAKGHHHQTTTTNMTMMNGIEMPPPQSPAKRGRRRSTSSDASSCSSGAGVGGGGPFSDTQHRGRGGGGGGGGSQTSTSSNPSTRFAPSPRISAEI